MIHRDRLTATFEGGFVVFLEQLHFGRAGTLQEAKGSLKSASGRLGANLR